MAVLAALPEAVRAAFDLEGDAFSAALRAALAALPAEDAAVIRQQLQDVGLLASPAGPDLEQVLRQFEPLLQRIASAATDASQRDALEPVLTDLEQNGWKIRQPVQRLWAGERDAEALTAGLDALESALVRQLMHLLAS
jgi:hypothetical protein